MEGIYCVSFNSKLFKEILYSNSFFLNEEIILNFCNSQLKIKAKKMLDYSIKNKINIISIDSKYYPKCLRDTILPPFCIYITGDFRKYLSYRKIYIYKSNKMSRYGNDIIRNIVKNELVKSKCLILKKDFEIFKFENISQIKDTEKINIYYYDKLNEYSKIMEIELILSIIDMIIIPEATYDKKLSMTIDIMLEFGKDIYVFPNSIFSKHSYFSNYLIKNGANVIISTDDINNIL